MTAPPGCAESPASHRVHAYPRPQEINRVFEIVWLTNVHSLTASRVRIDPLSERPT
jgi:hypothetical protein